MQSRLLVAVCAAVLALPAAADAQMRPLDDGVRLGPGFRISPFVGFLTAFTRAEEWVFEEGGSAAFVQSDVDVAGGTAVGVHLEAPLYGRFGITAAGAFASRGDTDFSVRQTGETYRIDGHNVFLGRLGASLHLYEAMSELVMRQMNASLFAGGVVMHERPRNRLGTDDALASGTHFGVNMGATAEVPFGERFAVQVGLENNMMWWNDNTLAALPYVYFGRPGTTSASTTATSDVSSTWLLRAGMRIGL